MARLSRSARAGGLSGECLRQRAVVGRITASHLPGLPEEQSFVLPDPFDAHAWRARRPAHSTSTHKRIGQISCAMRNTTILQPSSTRSSSSFLRSGPSPIISYLPWDKSAQFSDRSPGQIRGLLSRPGEPRNEAQSFSGLPESLFKWKRFQFQPHRQRLSFRSGRPVLEAAASDSLFTVPNRPQQTTLIDTGTCFAEW